MFRVGLFKIPHEDFAVISQAMTVENPNRAVAEQSRGLLRRLPGGSEVDELLAERRAEAEREDTE